MKSSLQGLASGCALIVGSIVPSLASATDIPFYVTNNSNKALCILVTGPWARENGFPNLATPGTNRWHLYSAETGIFSPFGQWKLNYYEGHYDDDGHTCLPPGVNGFVDLNTDFCLEDHPSLEIDITINPDFSASVNAVPPPCDSLTATADLGHAAGSAHRSARRQSGNPAPGVQGDDRDTFGFEGDVGEAVTISLAGDPRTGHTGALAALQLLLGEVVIAEVGGPLPLDLSATLPEPGEYFVVVLEETEGGGEGFRGRYVLSVTFEAGSDERLLEPQADVEHF
ncbi:MAG: hypothetical protein ACREIR_21720 [Geminicoccaceae bacterium]